MKNSYNPSQAHVSKLRMMLAVAASFVKGIFAVGPTTDNTRTTYGGGRDVFLGVSAPRCHTQKKHYKGFAR